MNTRYKILQKSKLIFASAMFMILNLNIFSQNNLTDTNKIGLEQFHVICGKFKTFDSATNQLSIISKDTIVKFRISEYIINPNEYDSLLKNISVLENNKELINIEIEYFAVISYSSNSKSIELELFCKSFKLCKSNQTESELYNYKYEKDIKTLTGKLVRVEIGDYLHITIQTEDGKLHSFWVYYDIGEETKELLYSKADQALNDSVLIKYCNTVGYVAEIGKPMLMDTCVAVIFE